MALTELEQKLINSLQESQQQQTETIKVLQTQISGLSSQVEQLIEAYNNLAQVYSNGTVKGS